MVIRELPASERFFAGGDTTVRGFALDSLGTDETLDPQGFPQGGNGMAIFNVEARAPYWKNLQLVVVPRCRQRVPARVGHPPAGAAA